MYGYQSTCLVSLGRLLLQDTNEYYLDLNLDKIKYYLDHNHS